MSGRDETKASEQIPLTIMRKRDKNSSTLSPICLIVSTIDNTVTVLLQQVVVVLSYTVRSATPV